MNLLCLSLSQSLTQSIIKSVHHSVKLCSCRLVDSRRRMISAYEYIDLKRNDAKLYNISYYSCHWANKEKLCFRLQTLILRLYCPELWYLDSFRFTSHLCINTVCPRSSIPFYIVSYYIKGSLLLRHKVNVTVVWGVQSPHITPFKGIIVYNPLFQLLL